MFKKSVLKNGLRIISAPMVGTEAVTVLVFVGAGSKYEKKSINGISHFVEHMLFKGTVKRPTARDISTVLDSIGGEFNAFTSKEYTGYYAKVDAKHLDIALDVVSDMFLNSKFEEAEIAKEKGVIIEEINMVHDTPMRHVGGIFEDLLYGDQPAGWEIAGTKETVTGLKRSDFINYLSDYYVSQNTILVIAGKFNKTGLTKKIDKYFGEIKTNESLGRVAVVEKQVNPRVRVEFKDTNQTHFCLGARAYNIFDEKRYVATLLAIILGGNMSSRLFIEVREKRGLAYYIRCGLQPYLDSGYLVTQAGVDNNRLDEAISLVWQEYKKIAEQRVSQKELQNAKDYLKGTTMLELESSDAVAEYLGAQEILTKTILTPKQKFDKIDKVTVDDIGDIAKEIFALNKMNLALIGPFKDEARFKKLII